jgi:hypothetical protein
VRPARGVWARRATLLTVSGLLFAANLGFFLWYRSTTRQRQEGLENRRAVLERDVQAAEAEATRLARQREHLSLVSEALDDFYAHRIGSSRETLAPMVDEVHAVLRKVGVSPAQITYASSELKDLPLTELRISFVFRNDYNRFKQLIAALESDKRWIAVREVGLSRAQDEPGAVQVQMQLSTYFVGEGKPAARVTAAASVGRS